MACKLIKNRLYNWIDTKLIPPPIKTNKCHELFFESLLYKSEMMFSCFSWSWGIVVDLQNSRPVNVVAGSRCYNSAAVVDCCWRCWPWCNRLKRRRNHCYSNHHWHHWHRFATKWCCCWDWLIQDRTKKQVNCCYCNVQFLRCYCNPAAVDVAEPSCSLPS